MYVYYCSFVYVHHIFTTYLFLCVHIFIDIHVSVIHHVYICISTGYLYIYIHYFYIYYIFIDMCVLYTIYIYIYTHTYIVCIPWPSSKTLAQLTVGYRLRLKKAGEWGFSHWDPWEVLDCESHCLFLSMLTMTKTIQFLPST